MFNHVAHLTLKPETTDAQVEAILDALLGLPGQVPGLASGEVVRDGGFQDGNATLRFHMRFESQSDWEGYKSHPAHVAVIQNHIAPVIAGKAFVQYDDAQVRTASA